MTGNLVLTGVQLARAADNTLTGPDAAPVYLEQNGPVMIVSQGDDHAYYAPSGALLERAEIGIRQEGASVPEQPPDPEPDVFYVGEEAPPADDDPLRAPREMIVMYSPCADQPAPSVLERVAAALRGDLHGTEAIASLNDDGEWECSVCRSTTFSYRETVERWWNDAPSEDGVVTLYDSKDGDGSGDPGLVCQECEMTIANADEVTLEWQ